MIESHVYESSHTLYELGKIVLSFGLICLGLWIMVTLMVRSGNRQRGRRGGGINRQTRRAARGKRKRK